MGWSGEFLACRYLQAKFYLILSRNYRTKQGELDLIVLNNRTIHFIEVKTSLRSHKNYSNILRVNQIKQKKIKYLAADYLFKQRKNYIKYYPNQISFDVISVNWSELLKFKHVLMHYPNYFK